MHEGICGIVWNYKSRKLYFSKILIYIFIYLFLLHKNNNTTFLKETRNNYVYGFHFFFFFFIVKGPIPLHATLPYYAIRSLYLLSACRKNWARVLVCFFPTNLRNWYKHQSVDKILESWINSLLRVHPLNPIQSELFMRQCARHVEKIMIRVEVATWYNI